MHRIDQQQHSFVDRHSPSTVDLDYSSVERHSPPDIDRHSTSDIDRYSAARHGCDYSFNSGRDWKPA
ncbi:hypothetical protein F2Q69_00007117 [Brassica cretica]|uniref:Uncharacterized protein n=1 Tax=Brassica cretica TaxID=69181 RepID=A0A8S9P477_BRACR|nr:hypothetical protein F2Q69_00007117 [Brassica cretica]